MISGTPLVMGERLFVQSESGALAAFTVRLPEPPSGSADDTTEDTDEEG